MTYAALLTPVLLLLLMVLLGRLERRLDDDAVLPSPAPRSRRRWHRATRPGSPPAAAPRSARPSRLAGGISGVRQRRAARSLRRRPAAGAARGTGRLRGHS